MSEKVTVFGAGYVGLVTGVCLASAGHRVTVVDVDSAKLATLESGRCPFFEPDLEDLMRTSRDEGRLSFERADSLERLRDMVMVAVGTPATSTGSADLTAVRGVVDTIEDRAEPGTIVIMKSTVPPGTGQRFADRLAPHGIGYVSAPEFLREGTAVRDWLQADRIVLGGAPEAVTRTRALFADSDAPVLECDVTSAEMVKYASNAFLATKISFINEIAVLCELVDANIDEVALGVGMDERIGPAFLRPGIGYGGSCFPKDTRALDFIANLHGYDFHLLRSVIEVNARQRLLPVRALKAHFGTLEGRKVAVLGLTFKPDTDDTREAPAVDIIALLQAEGAHVSAYNPIPVTVQGAVALEESVQAAVNGCDAVILATEWLEIVRADWAALIGSMAGRRVVFDGRNALDPEIIRHAGGTYIGVGRPQGGIATCRSSI